MNHHFKPAITLIGYRIQFVDLRDPKPREVREDIFPLDTGTVAALNLTGQQVPEFIRRRYERGGFRVCSVDRCSAKRVAALDLRRLWNDAEA